MRLIIQPDYAAMSRWAANHVIERINAAAPTPEKPFVLGLPASAMDPAYPHTETVLIQGIIDAFFEEEGQIVLVDYKTDRVMGDPVQWAQRHRRQVELYARALTTLTGRPVVEKYVVFLNGRACVRL